MTRQRRALLVLDDLHWAANPTLLLLRHLIRSERPLSVLLLGAYRATELHPAQPLAQLLADLHRDASAERLSIRGLDEPAIAVLLEASGGHPVQERAELVRLLAAQTAGNPFFVRELLAHLAESGERPCPVTSAAQLETPERLRDVIIDRVARLSAPAGRALRVAAVAGPTFSSVLLERVLGEDSGVLDGLEEAVAAGVLIESECGEHVFAHALVRQTIYAQLGSSRRMRLHRQLGEALESLDEPELRVAALAHHFAHAAADGQGVKAAAYALAAGRDATARLGYEEAVAHYERGLEALALTALTQEQRRCELLLALGQAHWDAGELDKARQAYKQAAELAERIGDPSALAYAALGYSGPHRFEAATAVTQLIVELLKRALDALSQSDSALRAQLMGRLAAYADLDQDRRMLAGRAALRMARRVADKATLADVLASTHRAIRGPDALQESIGLAEELGRAAEEVGDRRLRTLAHVRLLDHLLELGDIDGVQRELERLVRLATARNERYYTWVLALVRANHAHLEGRLEDFERLAHDALAHRFAGRDELAAQMFGLQMFFARSAQGQLDELVEAAESFAQQSSLVAWRCVLACIYAQLHRRTQARHELEALARHDFSDFARDVFWLPSLSTLCEVVAFLGDAPRAQLLYTLLLPYTDRCPVTFALLCQGSASRPLGLLATTMSRFEDAARHFEQALTMNAHIRSPLWIAHTQHDYAHMLLLRNHPQDRDKALELLDQAITTAHELGLKALANKARPLKREAEATGPPPTLAR
jgi:eukaryotic-like serine/threonine-protein kinase